MPLPTPDYPGAIFNPDPNINNSTEVNATYMDDRDIEIKAIENALGINLVPTNGPALVKFVQVVGSNPYDLSLIPPQTPPDSSIDGVLIGTKTRVSGNASKVTIQKNSDHLRLQTQSEPASYFAVIEARYDSTHPFAINVANNLTSTVEIMGMYADAAGPNPRVAFPTGNIGIGTTTPRFKTHVNGTLAYGVPNSWSSDSDLSNGQVSAYLDEGANQLKFRVKYSNGTLKTGTVGLT